MISITIKQENFDITRLKMKTSRKVKGYKSLNNGSFVGIKGIITKTRSILKIS